MRAAFRSIKLTETPGWLEGIATPVLVITAAQERIVNNAATDAAVARLPNAEHVLIDAARHDLLSETDATRAEVWVAIDRFLERTKGWAAAPDHTNTGQRC